MQNGQHIRLIAEVVDPESTSTVWTHSVDAARPSELLPALDRLLRKARGQLGESLQQVQATSSPLEKVVTPNIDALRALSSALALEREGSLDQAERLHRHAIALDPGFATAYRALGSVLVQQERYLEGRMALETALAIAGRLTEREGMFTQAFLSEFSDPELALSQWRALVALYPQNGTGQHNAGMLYYASLHDYSSGAALLADAATERNPFLNYTLHSLGYVLLGSGRFAEAESRFRAALQFSTAPILFGLSDALAAQGKYDEAARYLDETKRGSSSEETERALRRATLLVAQRDLIGASAEIEHAVKLASRLTSPNGRWRASAALIALQHARGNSAEARAMIARLLRDLTSQVNGGNPMVMEQLLYAAGWAARLGLTTHAEKAISVAQKEGALDKFPVRLWLAEVAQAEIDLSRGQVALVLERLRMAAEPTPLWEFHELRARALRAKGDSEAERTELSWLASHAGLAYAQRTDQLLGQQARILDLMDAKARIAPPSKPGLPQRDARVTASIQSPN